ncbi:MAG: divalent-cation tolerance protein CutA [Nitrospinaceae bacterium]|jgi:periplasmic divalent cation tolerance protein|nr:divalent-cation tolerance protein CutA [Nitrospinaceae bacterium]|tara:strand:+ start:73 stop:396 length:324 start_codon:yes stop_codon:yes gene_type:complete
MSEHCVIFITAGSKEEADKISRGLVESKLAFCVSTLPKVQSTYYWEDKIHVDKEFLLIVKTRQDQYEALETWVKNNHSYEVPEIIALPIEQGLPAYLNGIDDWVAKD